MKEIIFRAKSFSGDWVYGNFIHSKRFEGCGNEYRIHNIETGLESDVIPDTVGQFTGLTDVYGNRIFEGDIISYKAKIEHLEGIAYNNIVYWLEYRWRIKGVKKFYSDFTSNQVYNHEIKVVGNIHDNPELIK